MGVTKKEHVEQKQGMKPYQQTNYRETNNNNNNNNNNNKMKLGTRGNREVGLRFTIINSKIIIIYYELRMILFQIYSEEIIKNKINKEKTQ